jgi:hypothetical protein
MKASLRALALVLLLPGVVSAQEVDDATRRAARNLGVAGVEAFEAEDYATASDKLDRAYRTLKVPSLGLWSARAFVKLDKLVEAAERYQEVVRLEIAGGDRAVQQQAQADAALELEKLSMQIPNVIVRVAGADPEKVAVSLDGTPLTAALIGERRPVNPGKHLVRGVAAGQAVDAEVTLAVGETKPVELRFGTDAPSAESAATLSEVDSAPAKRTGALRRTTAFVFVGVGGAGLVLGGVATGLALGKRGSIDDNPNCRISRNECLQSERALVESYDTWRTISGVGLIGGAVLAAVGVGLLLSAPQTPAQTALIVTPGSIVLSSKF